MPDINEDRLTDLLYDACVKAYQKWRDENANERVFAFALNTLDDAIYINANLNTIESHERKLGEEDLDAGSPEALEAKWSPTAVSYTHLTLPTICSV